MCFSSCVTLLQLITLWRCRNCQSYVYYMVCSTSTSRAVFISSKLLFVVVQYASKQRNKGWSEDFLLYKVLYKAHATRSTASMVKLCSPSNNFGIHRLPSHRGSQGASALSAVGWKVNWILRHVIIDQLMGVLIRWPPMQVLYHPLLPQLRIK